jgi:hypothetical protein
MEERLMSDISAEEMARKLIECVPITWLDPLLTGHNKVIGSPGSVNSYDCMDIEHLLIAIRKRMEETAGVGGGDE